MSWAIALIYAATLLLLSVIAVVVVARREQAGLSLARRAAERQRAELEQRTHEWDQHKARVDRWARTCACPPCRAARGPQARSLRVVR